MTKGTATGAILSPVTRNSTVRHAHTYVKVHICNDKCALSHMYSMYLIGYIASSWMTLHCIAANVEPCSTVWWTTLLDFSGAPCVGIPEWLYSHEWERCIFSHRATVSLNVTLDARDPDLRPESCLCLNFGNKSTLVKVMDRLWFWLNVNEVNARWRSVSNRNLWVSAVDSSVATSGYCIARWDKVACNVFQSISVWWWIQSISTKVQRSSSQVRPLTADQ